MCFPIRVSILTVFPNFQVDDMSKMRNSTDVKRMKVHGILGIIEACNYLLEINFPLQRDDGSYEMITGYRAQVGINHDKNIRSTVFSSPPTITISASLKKGIQLMTIVITELQY